MNKKEFQKRIDKANRLLLIYYRSWGFGKQYRHGVCTALANSFKPSWTCLFNVRIAKDFETFLKPKNTRKDYWLGSRIDDKILERRQIALRLFEQHAIDNKLYRKY